MNEFYMSKLKKINRAKTLQSLRHLPVRHTGALSARLPVKLSGVYNKLSGEVERAKKTEILGKAEDRFGDAKKHAAMAGVAVVATASLLAAGLFGSPADPAQNPNGQVPDRAFTPAYEQVLTERKEEEPPEPEGTESSGDGSGSPAEQNNIQLNASEKIRAELLKLPLWLRSLAGLPLWCIGRILLYAGENLWGGALSPVLSSVISWILALLLVLTVVAATVKAICPDIPLRKIFSKKTVMTAVIAVAVLAVADTAGRILSPDYERISGIVRFCLPVIAAAGIVFTVLWKYRKTGSVHVLKNKSSNQIKDQIRDQNKAGNKAEPENETEINLNAGLNIDYSL